LTASASVPNWTLIDNEGGKYTISSNKTTRIVTTVFSLTSPALVNMSIYRLANGSLILINSTSTTGIAGSLTATVPLVYGNGTFFASIYKNNVFIKSVWVDLRESGKDYFGTLGLVLAGFLLLTIMLMAVSEGAGFIIFTGVALLLVIILNIIDMSMASLILVLVAGGIILYKLVKRRT
jgi:hypothetical protein